jgi:uncharacterized membrane protein required for colicin V production
MAIDVLILVLLGFSVLYGYGQGFMRGLTSLISPILGIWLALRRCGSFAPVLDQFVHNYRVSVVIAFLAILAFTWLALRFARAVLLKLVDWPNLAELDQYFGGLLGLAKGVTLIWVMLALSLTALPVSVRVIAHSSASMRILAMGERFGTKAPEQGERHAVRQEGSGNLEHSLALLRQSYGPRGDVGHD